MFYAVDGVKEVFIVRGLRLRAEGAKQQHCPPDCGAMSLPASQQHLVRFIGHQLRTNI